MNQRIWTLCRHHFFSLLFSLSGLIYIILSLVFYQIFFAPGQRTPDGDYLLFVLGLFGAAFSFLVTLSMAARAYEATSTIFIVRLSSRVEYLTALLLGSVIFTSLVQLVLALLVIFVGNSQITTIQLWQIPPVWLAVNILAAVLAFHASDFASSGWSRTTLFGILLVLLFSFGRGAIVSTWLGDRFSSLAGYLFRQEMVAVGDLLQRVANWLYSSGGSIFSRFLDLLFWPFRAISEALLAGSFSPRQALAPAVLLIYATFLFLTVSELLARKDMHLQES